MKKKFKKMLKNLSKMADSMDLSRCPRCGGALTPLAPADTSGPVIELGYLCEPCYEKYGEA